MGLTVAATATALLAEAASAQAVDAGNPGSVLEAVRSYGHKARLETDDAGLPVIHARVDDINYGIQFYGCQGVTGCSQLQLAASFDLDPGLSADFVNRWNEEWAIGRLSVDDQGDPLFTFFLSTGGGGLSAANFTAVLDTWTGALTGVVADIGY